MQLSENELVTLLLCSDLAVGDVSPLSDSAYSAFATALYKENRQPSDLFSMSSENIAEIYQKYRQVPYPPYLTYFSLPNLNKNN